MGKKKARVTGFLWLTELSVKVCSMYGAVCFARLQRCSTRLVCVRESIRWISRGACASLCLQCREAELSEGGESVQRSRKSWQPLRVQKLPLSSSLFSLSLSINIPPLVFSLPPSLALFAVNSSSFLLHLPPSPSMCLHALSGFLLRPQHTSLTHNHVNKSR